MPKLTLTVEVDDETAAWLVQTGKINEPTYLGEVLRDEMEVRNRVLRYFYTFSHETRPRIRGIQSHAELLLLQPEGIGNLTDIQMLNISAIKHIAFLLNKRITDEHAAMMIEEKQLTFTFQEIQLGNIVQEVISLEREKFDSKSHTVTTTVQENLPLIHADKFYIREALEILLDNAYQYSCDNGQIEIVLKQDGEKIHIQVKDSGVGIEQKDFERIFEKYYRSEIAENEADGHGMGLYLAKYYIEAQGGKIWIESEVGKGTTVHFTMPIAEREK